MKTKDFNEDILNKLVGTDVWDCSGKELTPTLRKHILKKIVNTFEFGLVCRLEDFGETASVMDFLHEETVEQFPFRHEHGDDLVDWVADFLYEEWDVKKNGWEDHPSVFAALTKFDEWYEGLLIKDILAATSTTWNAANV